MLRKPFYPEAEIVTKYTEGNEFVLRDTGADYVGVYHMLPNDTYWTGSKQSNESQELVIKRFDASKRVQEYNKARNFESVGSLTPKPYWPRPTIQDYENGEFYRYFAQKKNDRLNTIMEIDEFQFRNFGRGLERIDEMTWDKIAIKWKLVSQYASAMNKHEVESTQRTTSFKFLEKYLTNYLEFTK